METFDSAVEAGWRRFTIALGDRLAAMDPGDSHVIRLDFLADEGWTREHAPFVVFTTHGTTRLRCTVCAATATEDELLAAAGWRARGRFPRTMEVTRRRADRLARAAVDVLRHVVAVPDATFVDGTPAATPTVPGPVGGPDALQRMVDATIAEISGQSVGKDPDGDIPMPTAVPSWLRVREDEAAIELFCTRICSADAVTTEMLFAAAERWPGVSCVARSGALLARMRIEAADFSPVNLRSELTRWFAFLEHGVEVFRAAGDPEDEPGEADHGVCRDEASSMIRTADVTTTAALSVTLPAQLEALLLVTTAQSATLRPDEIAGVMDRDRDVILRCHRVCIGARDAWETAADSAAARDDVEEAHACLVESWRWEDVARSLRGALRVVVVDRRPSPRASDGHRRDDRPRDHRPRDPRPPREQRPGHIGPA